MESVRIVRLPSQDAVSLSFLDTETPAIRIEAKLLQKSRLVADILSEELDNKDSIGDEDAGAVLYTPPGFFSSWLQHVRNPSTDLESVSQMVLILQVDLLAVRLTWVHHHEVYTAEPSWNGPLFRPTPPHKATHVYKGS